MLQRIQTLYLFLVLVLSVLLFMVPFCEFPFSENLGLASQKYVFNIYGFHFHDSEGEAKIAFNFNFPLLINLLIILNSVVIIYVFKNRKLQLRLGKLNLLLISIILGIVFSYTGTYSSFISLEHSTSYRVGAYLPLLSLVLNYLAIRAIKKDEDLVRSADRIR